MQRRQDTSTKMIVISYVYTNCTLNNLPVYFQTIIMLYDCTSTLAETISYIIPFTIRNCEILSFRTTARKE
jgi:hypothetical protein